MSIANFVPHIFSASILRGYEKASVFANITSREYSGEVKNCGDRVRVPKIGPVAIKNYQKGTPITYDGIDGSYIDVVVDQSKYWALKAEDIDQLQTAPNFLDGATANAAYALRDEIDTYSAKILTEGAGTKLYEGAAFVPPSASLPTGMENAGYINLFTEIAMHMNELNVPMGGRFCVIPPFVLRGLTHSVIAAGMPNERPIGEGFVTRISGLDIYVSNNLVTETNGDTWVLAGVREAATHILQLTKTEALRDKDSFSDLVRGLGIYTTAVLLPPGLVTALVKKQTA
jgi:hypothetical protein